jgi:hypothetical protein
MGSGVRTGGWEATFGCGWASGTAVCSVKGVQLLVQIVNKFLRETTRDYSIAPKSEQWRGPDESFNTNQGI